jgi:glycosyltransferase involved in cell wall biosynthesis
MREKQNGEFRTAAPQQLMISPLPLDGAIDRVDPAGLIVGWCASVTPPFTPRRISILLDGIRIQGGIICNLPREDLARAGIGDGRHGFEVLLPATALNAETPCKVSLRDEDTGQAIGYGVEVCWAPRNDGLLEANIDQVSPDGIVSGWCFDHNDRTRNIDLEILLNGAVCGVARANLYREDLSKAGKGSGRHGFVFALDTTRLALQPTHTVSLRAVGSTMQIGLPLVWRWPLVERVENRLAAMERRIEALADGSNARDSEAPKAAGGPAVRQARGQLNLAWISGEIETPGHTYRVLRMVEAAQALGHKAWYLPAAEAMHALDALRRVDALFIWRAPLNHALRAVIESTRFAGATIFFDIDDLMVEPALARRDIIDAIRSEKHPVADVRRLYQGIKETALLADATIVTTRELGAFVQALQKPVHVVPNGFDLTAWRRARLAVRRRALAEGDGLLRIGYAGGSRTHQRDFALVAPALGRVLRKHRHCRLVLFRHPKFDRNLVDIAEFPALAGLESQIEWRDMVAVEELPDEIARFDINLAPLETGNVFCEAKSELKFFEAALAGVPTIASPTGPYRRAIRGGETGLLAGTEAEWHAALSRLVADAALRGRMAQAAYHDALRLFGPERRQELLGDVLAQLSPGRQAARAFELALRRQAGPPPALPHIPVHNVVQSLDRGGEADVSVIIPLYNYANYVTEALDSVWHQDIALIDLIVVDDRSTDNSLAVVTEWVNRNGARFNRVVILQNLVNSGLGLTRNAGFAAAETPYVMPLDADNRLLPQCLGTCLAAIQADGAAFAYPSIYQFGETQRATNAEPYWPARLSGGNFIDAMAMVAQSAWAAVGGYDHVRFGWEDYDFWCRMAAQGMWGVPIAAILCEYRVHAASMLRVSTDVEANKLALAEDLERRHHWVNVAHVLATKKATKLPHRQKVRQAAKTGAPRRPMVAALADAAHRSNGRHPA